MKKNIIKSSAVLLTSLFCLNLFQPLTTYAASDKAQDIVKEYLEDGSYFETTLLTLNTRSTLRGAVKRTTYYNKAGDPIWHVEVTANFTFDGSSAKCTSATASAKSYVSNWKILDTASSRSGNSGTATALDGSYVNGVFVGSMTESVTIYCDKNGKVS